ncbi:MAG: alpha/beta hydrolase domain-containing protein [Asticcacaulis sp.]
MSRRTLFGSVAALAALTAMPVTASARPLPRVTQLPDAGAKGLLIWDVTGLGYIAEEFMIEGKADVLESVSMADAVDMSKRNGLEDFLRRDFNRTVVAEARPYATRVVVYRPIDMSRFSGRILLEVLHPSGGGRANVWQRTYDLLADRGDITIGIQPPFNVKELREGDPVRYGKLHAEHPTQLWDVVTDVARLTKTVGEGGLLGGAVARHQVLAGFSYTGVATANYANFQHDRARLADGRPLIDGYMPMGSATFVRPLDVPVIRMTTQSEFDGIQGIRARVPDSDDPKGRCRLYEVAGAPHSTVPLPVGAALAPTKTVPEPAGLPRFSPETCQQGFPETSYRNDFPLHLVIEGIYVNIFEWIENGVVPPHAPLIEVDAEGRTLVDEFGNARGGLRLPEVTVPIATYGVGAKGPCGNFGYTKPFTIEEKRRLYGNKAAYVSRVRQASETLFTERFVTAKGKNRLIGLAAATEAF